MIQLSRNYSLPDRDEEIIPIKVIGVGGAGANALDRVVLDGLDKDDLVVANTDVQSLASSVAGTKVQLGRSVTRGLGTGGDPELGYDAAMESADEIRQALGEARLIFICAGLGGGTGSGSAPVIAEIARETGALVISFATMPFGFEGKRRMAQANEALVRLQQASSAVICFDNDKMGDIVAPKAGIHQAFAASDLTLSQSVRSIISLIQRPGLIRIGFDDLLAALRSPNARCLFGFGESDSDNRAYDALTQALKNPLMDRGRLLEDAANVLVQVAGGPGMTLSEVESLMQELNRHIGEETQILFSTCVDGRMGNRMAVTLISSLSADGKVVPMPKYSAPAAAPKPTYVAPPIQPKSTPAPAPQPVQDEADEIASAPEPPAAPERPLRTIEAKMSAPDFQPELVQRDEPEPEPIAPEPVAYVPAPPPPPAPVVEPEPEQLQFESVTRGRFEKSEPTIVEGQDLDVPTFLRKNVKVK
jgi:cell division protein FtsZ